MALPNTTQQEEFPSGSVSLTDPEPTFGQVSLLDQGQVAAVPPEVANPRALKAHIGLGKDSPGLEVLTSGIANGQEQQLRQDLSQVQKASLRLQKMSALQDIAKDGANANMDEAQALLNWQPNPNPNTLFEKNFARQYTTLVADNEKATTMAALAQDANRANQVLDASQDMIAKQELFKKNLEDFEQRQLSLSENQASILSEYPVSSTVTSMVTPFMSQLNLRNAAASTASLLPGNNLEEQVIFVWSQPTPEESAQVFSQAMARLETVSPADARTFAHAVLGYTSSERLMNNLQPFIDATIVGGPLFKLSRLMKSGVKANAAKDLNVGNTLTQVGDIEKAADVKAVEQAKARLNNAAPVVDKGFDPLGQKLDLTDALPSWANPNTLAFNPGSMSRERAARQVGKLIEIDNQIEATLGKVARVSRTTEEELQAGLAATRTKMETEHHSILDSVLDVKTSGVADFEHIPAEKTRSNVDYLSMNLGKAPSEVVLGKEDATLFKSVDQANNYAQRELGLDYKQYVVREGPGTKYYISVPKAVDETDPALRSVGITTLNKNNESLTNYFLGYVRTPADQVSSFIRNNRLIATTAPSEILKMVQGIAKNFQTRGISTLGRGLSNKSWDRLDDVLAYYRDFMDYTQSNSRGKYPSSFGQLEKDWKKVTGRLPSDKEQLAFWSVIKVNDFDYMLRNFNLHRDLARQGVEHVSFPHPTVKGEYPDPIWGKVIDNTRLSFDPKSDDAVLAIFRDGEYTFTTKHSNMMKSEEGDKIKRWLLQPNVKVTQIANPDDRPLKGVLDRHPHFVISEDIKTSPLPVNLVPYNGGGHVIYPGGWYLKQPIVEQGLEGRWYHYGDQTIMNFTREAQAKFYAPKLDEFRLKLKRGDTDLDEFVQKNLPKDVDFWTSKFKGPNAILSLDEPIMITQRNASTFSTNPKLREQYKERLGQDVISYPESPYNLTSHVDKSFLQERDGPLMSIKNVGSQHTPIYQLEQAEVLRPLYAMERGIHNALRGLYLNDVKTSTVEQWIKQYKDILKDPWEIVQRNPNWQLYHGEFVPTTQGNFKIIQSAENARRNLKNFLRSQSEFGEDINRVEEEVFNRIYNKGGIGDGTVKYYASHDWNMIKHPIDFLRSASSNMRFGWFNLVQAYVQSMGVVTAATISPIHGMSGLAALALHDLHLLGQQALTIKVSEGVLNILDKAARIAGWKKGTFAESVKEMEAVGLQNIGRTVSIRESFDEPTIFKGKYQTFIDKSYIPFNFGDRNTRLMSWHTAFHEWRSANPDAVVTDRIRGEILKRADNLGTNMLRESNSAFQQGVAAPVAQWQSFRMRLAEQMFSSQPGRLTEAEKFRALVGGSIAFGLPVAVSALGVPWARIPGGVENIYDDVKKWALDNGLNTDGKFFKVMNDGLLEYLQNLLVTEKYPEGHPKAGQTKEYGLTKRYGPGVDKGIREMLIGEGGYLEIIPAGSLLENIIKGMYPFWVAGRSDQFHITHDDIARVMRENSSYNNTYNGYMAWNYQKYISKNQQVVSNDMSKTDAIMLGLLGQTRKDIIDTRLMQSVFKDEKGNHDAVGKRVLEEYRKMMDALDKSDFPKADIHLSNAQVYMGPMGDMNEKDRLQLWNQALSEREDLTARVTKKFYDPILMPPSKMSGRLRRHFGLELEESK